jgi:hypothetical protein
MSKRRPSPAMVVAMIALCLGLGGSAIAAGGVTKSQMKKIAKKQANKQINKREAGLSVAHAKTADSATNAQAATNASAVGGNSVTKFTFLAPDGTGSTELFNVNGLRMTASCPDSSLRPDIKASATGTPQGVIKVEGIGFPGNVPVLADLAAWNSASGTVDVDGGVDRGVAELSFFREDGLVVTVNYSWDDGVRSGNPVCGVAGHVIAG